MLKEPHINVQGVRTRNWPVARTQPCRTSWKARMPEALPSATMVGPTRHQPTFRKADPWLRP